MNLIEHASILQTALSQALAAWHLVPNGDLADIIAFLGIAISISIEHLPNKVTLRNVILYKSKALSKFKNFFFEQRNDANLSQAFHELSLIKVFGPQNKTLSCIYSFYRRFIRAVEGSKCYPASGNPN